MHRKESKFIFRRQNLTSGSKRINSSSNLIFCASPQYYSSCLYLLDIVCSKMRLTNCKLCSPFLVSFALVIFILITNGHAEKKETIQKDFQKDYKFVYPYGGKDERDIQMCSSSTSSPCNLVTNPFFTQFLVTRLCRCPVGVGECPHLYEPKRAGNTVQINNRQQIKFCEDVPKCEKDAAVLETKDGLPTNLTCSCLKRRRWKLVGEWVTSDDRQAERYTCEKLPRCKNDCGHLRLDNYATYHHCTCPQDKLCVPKSMPPVNIREVLYKGPGLVSECMAFS